MRPLLQPTKDRDGDLQVYIIEYLARERRELHHSLEVVWVSVPEHGNFLFIYCSAPYVNGSPNIYRYFLGVLSVDGNELCISKS